MYGECDCMWSGDMIYLIYMGYDELVYDVNNFIVCGG